MIGHDDNGLIGASIVAMIEYAHTGAFPQIKVDQRQIPQAGAAVKPCPGLGFGFSNTHHKRIGLGLQDIGQKRAHDTTVFNQKYS